MKIRHLPHLKGRVRWFIVMPDEVFYKVWDYIISFGIIFAVTISPYRLAFWETQSTYWSIIDFVVDLLFILDIVLNFFFATYDPQERIVYKPKEIAKNYLKTWFAIDLISSIPVNLILGDFGPIKGVLRAVKLSKLSTLFKLNKLIRIFRLIKYREKMVKLLVAGIRIQPRYQRIFSSFILNGIIFHLICCLWHMVAFFNLENPDNWITRLGYADSSNLERYISSIYWVIQTIFTVGYGDFPAYTEIELYLSFHPL